MNGQVENIIHQTNLARQRHKKLKSNGTAVQAYDSVRFQQMCI